MPMSPAIALVFSEVLGVPAETVTDAMSPENTPEWDSVQAMNLVSALEEAFSVRFSTREILSMKNVGLVRKVLDSKGVTDA